MSNSSPKNRPRVRIGLVTPQTGPESIELGGRIAALVNPRGTEEADLDRFDDPDFVKDLTADNFDQVLAETAPEVTMEVPNVLGPQPEGTLQVRLNFSTFEDFQPAQIAGQVPEMQERLRKRERLNEWLTKIVSKPRLAAELRRYLMNRQPGSSRNRKES